MQRTTKAPVILLSLVLLTVGLSSTAAQTDDDAATNGIVYMVHGHFEPAVTDPPPPIHEAFAATQEDGNVVFYVIPYSVDTEAPTQFDVDDTTIAIEGATTSYVAQPRAGTTSDQRCVDETTIPGHDGPISACLVVEAPADQVPGGAVEIVLRGTHVETDEFVIEAYSSPAHVSMHTTMEDGQPGWTTADELSGITTPFLIEDLVDPVP